MIVNESLGAAEVSGQFGCPYHGIVQGGKLTLPTSQQIDYPQPTSDADVPEEDGRTLIIQPSWAKGDTTLSAAEQTEATAKGWQWKNYAVIAGGNSQLHGQELGKDCWLWAEAPGKIWIVNPSELLALDPETAGGSTITLKLTRFGWLGELPADQEKEKTITITLPDDLGQGEPYPDLSGKYVPAGGVNYYEPYLSRLDNIVTFRLQDTRRADGGQALFGIVCTNTLNTAGQYYVVGVLLIDLAQQSATIMATRADLGNNVKSTPYGPQDLSGSSVSLVTISNEGGCVSGGGSDYIATSEYQINPTANGYFPDGQVSNGFEVENKMLLGAGFNTLDEPDLVWLHIIERMDKTMSGVFSASGQNIHTDYVAFDSSNRCYIASSSDDNNAEATSITEATATRTATASIKCGDTVLVSRATTGIETENGTVHINADGVLTIERQITRYLKGWDGIEHHADYSDNTIPNAFYSFEANPYCDYGYDPRFQSYWISISTIYGMDNTDADKMESLLDAYQAGPGVFCFRIQSLVHLPAPFDQYNDINALYTQFCDPRGPLPIADITRTEQQRLSNTPSRRSTLAQPIYATGSTYTQTSAGDEPVAVV